MKTKLKMPHPYVLIVMLIIFCTIMTYIVPAGTYNRYLNKELNRTLVEPTSFHYVEQTPVAFFEMVQAIPKGMTEVGWIIFLVFIVGGSFQIINATGAIEAGLGASIKKMKGMDKFLLIGIMAIFSLGGATFGLAESTLIFIPIGVMLARALGYDAIVGMAIVSIGAVCGFAGGWMNIFTVGVAQGIAELPLFSGMGYRILSHIVFLIISSGYMLYYAGKIRKTPSESYVYDLELAARQADGMQENILEFTWRRKLALIVVAAGFTVLIYGITHGWSTGTQISSLFLVMGVVAGYVGGLKSDEIADSFIQGAKGIAFGALLVGLCRAMVVVLTNGQIIDTILYTMANALDGLPTFLAAGLMVPVQMMINFLINSGSGQAATTMPIMAPLADVVGISRQTAVLAYQYGDGLSNCLWPTSGILMAGLSIPGIPYDKWFKWIWKLMLLLYLAASIMTMVSAGIGYH